MSGSSSSSGGVGVLGLLFVLFVGLKLTHAITWSWWWVTAPLWVPGVLIFVVVLLVAAIPSWRRWFTRNFL